MNGIFALVFALVLAPQDNAALSGGIKGARTPAYAPDGRIAVSIDGDLYAQTGPNGAWLRLTTGPAWDRDPDSAFIRWFDEPPGADPHRRNILSARYTEIGIGISEAYSGGFFFIADFGSR